MGGEEIETGTAVELMVQMGMDRKTAQKVCVCERERGGGTSKGGEHVVVGFVGEGVEREIRLRALRHTSPHTVGCIGVCDEEEGMIECPSHARSLTMAHNPPIRMKSSTPDPKPQTPGPEHMNRTPMGGIYQVLLVLLRHSLNMAQNHPKIVLTRS